MMGLITFVSMAQAFFTPNATLQEKLNEYINRDEPEFKWRHENTFTTLMGGKAHRLNVTSLKWLDESVYEVE